MNYNHHLALLFLTRAEGSHKTGIIDLLNYTLHSARHPQPQPFGAGLTDAGAHGHLEPLAKPSKHLPTSSHRACRTGPLAERVPNPQQTAQR